MKVINMTIDPQWFTTIQYPTIQYPTIQYPAIQYNRPKRLYDSDDYINPPYQFTYILGTNTNNVFTPWTTKIQDDGSLLLKLDLPGVLDTDLSIETFEKTLEIKVFSKRFDNENQDIHTQVINTTMYDLEKIEATFKHCVLELVIPVKVERKSIVKITFKK